jgi:hypothetical protein
MQRPREPARLYGYRANEVPVAGASEVKPGFSVEPILRNFIRSRRVCAVSLGPHLLGAVPPHWDIGHGPTSVKSSTKRIGSRLPKLARTQLANLDRFVDDLLVQDFPFTVDSVGSVNDFINSWNQPERRREELRVAFEECHDPYDIKFLSRISSFIKREFKDLQWNHEQVGDEFKAARLINARCDRAKALFGPIGKAVDHVVFDNDHFIKKVPIAQRSSLISDRLVRVGNHYFVIDYESFECSFQRQWMEHVEFRLIDHIIRSVPALQDFVDYVLKNVVAGRNVLTNFLFKCIIEATRMSGEMFTSCFNGFSNYVLVKYLFGSHLLDFFLEGDDNVGATDCYVDVVAAAKELGFKIKIDWITHPGKSSFCGLVFDEEGVIIRDALPVLAKFGWTDSKYDGASLRLRRRLIRSKAMSLAYENPQCPILWKLAKKFLGLTQGAANINIFKHVDFYHRQRYREALLAKIGVQEPSVQTRLFYEEMYGVSIAEQLAVESDIDKIRGLDPMILPNLSVPENYAVFYDTYVSQTTFPYCSFFASSFASRDVLSEDI